ncbi:MAG TPA: acyltransferase family protein, partial [Steroidobacteraceae bacterium]|nr:acyltransferase family protein [Steroidobacteraceae bacterium]
MKTEERLHALDAVRAFALLAGIVLHAAMSFMPGLTAFGFPADSSQSPALQDTFYVIHIFRMALFFFVAGYFSHLMFHRKGTAGFVGDRIKRIGVPMLLGWLAFGPMTMGMVYMGLAPHVAAVAGAAPSAPAATPFPLSHLWFLYYLLMFYGAALSARHFFIKHLDPKSTIRRYVDNTVSYVVRKNKAPLLLAAPLAVCLYFTKNWVMWSGVPTPDSGFAPQMPALIG